jgi:8-oxo-dGTP pyrophosphatase MutT (NUDIX family)
VTQAGPAIPPVPAWLRRLAADAGRLELPPVLRPPAGAGRPSAVLVLFGQGPGGPGDPDLLFIQRSSGLRLHAGQPAFPGGSVDPADSGPVAAALREAAEEVGVDPAGVEVVGTLPELFIPPTGFRVVPVLAWWRRPVAVAPVDTGEVAAVERVSVSELADPAARVMVRVRDGRITPAFRVKGMVIWGFTGVLVDQLLRLGGWERPWEAGEVVDLLSPALAAPASVPAAVPLMSCTEMCSTSSCSSSSPRSRCPVTGRVSSSGS